MNEGHRRAQDALRFQLVQHDAERFELKILTRDRQTYALRIDDILAKVRSPLGDSVRIEAHFAEELAHHTGKFRTVISHYRPANSPVASNSR
jgi:hypothetical protein